MVTTILSKGWNCSGRARFILERTRKDHNKSPVEYVTGNFDKYDPASECIIFFMQNVYEAICYKENIYRS